jgi:hypothetical protein
MCGTMPKLIERQQFEQCMKGMKGKKMRKQGKRGGDDEVRPESDVAPGDGKLEAMTDTRRRGKREPRRGGIY